MSGVLSGYTGGLIWGLAGGIVIAVAALFGVRPRTAPVLLQEHPQPVLSALEVILRIQRPQYFVVADEFIETGHDRAEGLGTADRIVEGLPHAPIEHERNTRAVGADPWCTGLRRLHGAAQTEHARSGWRAPCPAPRSCAPGRLSSLRVVSGMRSAGPETPAAELRAKPKSFCLSSRPGLSLSIGRGSARFSAGSAWAVA